MEEPRSSLSPVPALRQCYHLVNIGKFDTNHATQRSPMFIPHNVLNDSIIWLDLFSNERDLTFVQQMLATKQLTIFDTAADCIDFVELPRVHCSVTPVKSNFLVIVSGVYVTDVKVIKQLLEQDCVKQICLIVNEFLDGNLCPLYYLQQNINIIYNTNPDAVMRRFCEDQLRSKAFPSNTNEVCAFTNNASNKLLTIIVRENNDSTTTRVDNWNSKHDTLLSDLVERVEFKCDGRPTTDLRSRTVPNSDDYSSTRTTVEETSKVRSNQVNTIMGNRAFSTQNVKSIDRTKPPSQLDPTPSRHTSEQKTIEHRIGPTPINDKSARILEKLEKIKEVNVFVHSELHSLRSGGMYAPSKLFFIFYGGNRKNDFLCVNHEIEEKHDYLIQFCNLDIPC